MTIIILIVSQLFQFPVNLMSFKYTRFLILHLVFVTFVYTAHHKEQLIYRVMDISKTYIVGVQSLKIFKCCRPIGMHDFWADILNFRYLLALPNIKKSSVEFLDFDNMWVYRWRIAAIVYICRMKRICELYVWNILSSGRIKHIWLAYGYDMDMVTILSFCQHFAVLVSSIN